MRILLVDDSSPHRRLLTMLFNRSGHEALTAPDGAAALEVLEHEKDIDAVVSDVRMPKIDGFQLCRTIRNDARWAKLPFIFYSSIFIGDPAKTFGRDLGATAYLDAKDIAPDQVAKELERLVNQHVRAEYDETLGRLIDDVEFARRYHNVVLGSLGEGGEDLRELVTSSAKALDDVVTRLDAERRAATEAQRTVQSAELALLKELGEYLGDRINNPLAVILASAQLLEMKERSTATSEAAERIGAAVSKINEVVREIAIRSGEQPRP